MTVTPEDQGCGSGMYNLHCKGRFDGLEESVSEVGNDVKKIGKVLIGDPAEKIEGVVPMVNRHNHWIKGKEKKRARLSGFLIGAAITTVAMVAAGIVLHLMYNT